MNEDVAANLTRSSNVGKSRMDDAADQVWSADRWRLVLTLGCVLATFPNLAMPRSLAYDSEWASAMNRLAAEACDGRPRLGRDVVFSYGPLGPALAPMEIGDNRHLLWAAPLRLAFFSLFWVSVWRLLKHAASRQDAVLFVVGMTLSETIALFSGSVLTTATLNFAVLALLERKPGWLVPVGATSGFAILAKFSNGVASLLIFAVAALWVASRHRNRFGPVIVPLVGSIAALLSAVLIPQQLLGGGISALPGWLRDSSRLAAGYSEQLARPGEPIQEGLTIGAFGVFAAVALIPIVRRSPRSWLAVLMTIPALLLYKWSITRMEGFRIVSAGLALGGLAVLPLLTDLEANSRRLLRGAGWLLAVWNIFALQASAGWPSLLSGPQHLAEWLNPRATLAEMRAASERNVTASRLPDSWLERIGDQAVETQGSEDYSPLILHRLRWSPKPVLQSALTCDPDLDRRCADFFQGPKAPRFVLFRWETLDGTHPGLIDCATWTEIARWHDCADRDGERLLLIRRDQPKWSGWTTVEERDVALGEFASAPSVEEMLSAQASIELKPAGRLLKSAYKLPKPRLAVRRADGSTERWNLLWRNVESGFLVSGLPADAKDAAHWFSDPREAVAPNPGRAVAAIAIEADSRWFAAKIRLRWWKASAFASLP